MRNDDHSHDHSHDHGHDGHHHGNGAADGHRHHDPAGEVRSQPVLLDVGDGIGALIVHTVPDLLGIEVDLSPAGADGDRQHKQILRRTMGPETVTVLVYDNLPEGEYTVWLDESAPIRNVRVESGAIAELDLTRATEQVVG